MGRFPEAALLLHTEPWFKRSQLAEFVDVAPQPDMGRGAIRSIHSHTVLHFFFQNLLVLDSCYEVVVAISPAPL